MSTLTASAIAAYSLLALGSVGPAHAADVLPLAPPAEYQGKPIQQVVFEPLKQPVAPADLDRLVTLRTGQPLHLDDVRSTIRQLFSTGRYANIEVDAQPSANGVAVVIRTTDQWFVGGVDVRGSFNRPPTMGEIANASRLELGTPLEDNGIQDAVGRIRDLLHRNGFYLGSIQPQVHRDLEHQQILVTFDVDTNKRARLTLPRIIGDTRLPPDELAHAAGYKPWYWFQWKKATSNNVQSGIVKIRNKYDKADRLTASVRLQDLEYLQGVNRVRPVISAEGGPKVNVETSGVNLGRGTLKKYVPIYDLQTVNRDLLVIGVGNLRGYYQNQGYFDARVDFKIQTPKPDLETITYTISPGRRFKLVHVQIGGNHYFGADDIRERLFIQPAGLLWLRHGRYSELMLSRDEDSIRALYHSNGFLDVKVTSARVNNYKGKPGNVAVYFTIQEGPQYLVSGLQVEGIDGARRQSIVPRLACIAGEPFSDTNVGLDREFILTQYQADGYTDVRFQWTNTVERKAHKVAVRYVVTPGEQHFVRNVLLTGMDITRYGLVAPAIKLRPGEPLSLTTMGEMQRNLYNLGVFETVNMAVQNQAGATRDKYAVYHVIEGHRYYMSLGGGAEVARIGGNQTSLSQPAGATGFAPRVSFEARRLNLWGLGHSLNLKTRYSTLQSQVALNYLAPRYRNVQDRNISVTGLYDSTRDVRTFTRAAAGRLGAVVARFSKATHGVLALYMARCTGGPGHAKDQPAPDSAAGAARPRGRDCRQCNPGPPR